MTDQDLSNNAQLAGNIDVEREHAFDGITEFDNKLPSWWLWSFYLACIFSVFYWLAFHTFGFADLPMEEYRNEVAAAASAQDNEFTLTDVTDEGLRELALNEKVVARGKSVYLRNCLACHLESGAGIVGPNLTDSFWIRGGEPTAIYRTVTEGGSEGSGMIAWLSQLGEAKCQQVTAFVLTLRNKNIPGKDAQGEEYLGN